MLDKLPIGEPEPKQPLKCEECGLLFEEGNDWNNIDETGRCRDCMKSECCNAEILIREVGVSQMSYDEIYICKKCGKEIK